jgi:hypothetical protein
VENIQCFCIYFGAHDVVTIRCYIRQGKLQSAGGGGGGGTTDCRRGTCRMYFPLNRSNDPRTVYSTCLDIKSSSLADRAYSRGSYDNHTKQQSINRLVFVLETALLP